MALDESVIQQALIQVADATRAAVQVAQTAVRVQSSGAAPSTADGQRSGSLVDWSKLISKPNVFDNKSAEEDIRSFRDWHWMLSQYLTAIDQGFAAELKQLDEDPSKPLELTTASAETRQRSNKLYSLLASLVRNRTLSIVRSAPNADGYEALRQLILHLKPNTQTRGLALLSAITSYPSFNMSKPLLNQVIKLEELFEETRKSGTPVQDELKVAIILKCVGGQLKTQLNLMLDGSAKYNDVRDQIMRWDRSQQKWSGLVVPPDDVHHDEVVAMEVDRIGEKGWKKGKGDKGKYKGDSKGYSLGVKGKGKTKSKGKDAGKSFSKGEKGTKGKSSDSKGQGKNEKNNKICYRCGKSGHFARDCWAKVRAVTGEQVQASPSSSAGSNNQQQQSQQNSQSSPPQQGTQYRVSQIMCHFGSSEGSE